MHLSVGAESLDCVHKVQLGFQTLHCCALPFCLLYLDVGVCGDGRCMF